jgi:hypothetical protein
MSKSNTARIINLQHFVSMLDYPFLESFLLS